MNWRRFVPAGLLGILLAGCQTALPPSSKPQPALATVIVPEPINVATPAPLFIPATETNEPPSTAAAQPWPREWENAWVPLESWGRYNGLGKPIQLAGGLEPLFQMPTTNGLLLVKIGSQTLNFDGLQYGLGFAPRLIRGLPYVHSLDARKTLQTLLAGCFRLPAGNRTIVLDPGHGGRDSGAFSSVSRDCEKDYTLDLALRLARLLVAGGWNVVLTRTNDIDLSLADRVAKANHANAQLFLSLHFNSGLPNRDLAGVETYCLTPTGLPSNLVRDYEDDPRESHPNNAFDDQNVLLAAHLHRSVLRATGTIDRGVRHARFMAVLRGQNRPAVLLEGGYLSNPSEAHRIATPEYRQALAAGVAAALEPLRIPNGDYRMSNQWSTGHP
jgi:N-acetylmuramoyl-L-alanine amidase